MDDEKASLPVFRSWVNALCMWNFANTIYTACSNIHAFTGYIYNANTHPTHIHRHVAPYVEMESAFWEAYQSTKKMYYGCAAAIQFAVEHPEILVPLGSDYHGWQSHIYEPADVCPFR